MIRLENVCKGYMTLRHGWKEVLRNISIELPSDRNLGILGHNGAGKSTLMRVLSGLDLPDKGRVDTGGRHLSWPLGTKAGVHNSLTGRENIKFICRIYDKDIEEITDFVENFAELGDYMSMPVSTYSSGMRSRLAFGISMALDFDTYLIDEGFSTGDARFQKKTEAIFFKRRLNANMIVVSHSASTIQRFCDSAAILKDGQLVMYDDMNHALKTYNNLW